MNLENAEFLFEEGTGDCFFKKIERIINQLHDLRIRCFGNDEVVMYF